MRGRRKQRSIDWLACWLNFNSKIEAKSSSLNNSAEKSSSLTNTFGLCLLIRFLSLPWRKISVFNDTKQLKSLHSEGCAIICYRIWSLPPGASRFVASTCSSDNAVWKRNQSRNEMSKRAQNLQFCDVWFVSSDVPASEGAS